MRTTAALLILIASAGCSTEKEPPPPVHPLPPYQTAAVRLRDCDADVPLARDPDGSISEQIAGSGDSARICILLRDLKDAMQNGRFAGYSAESWSRVRSFGVWWGVSDGIRTIRLRLDVDGPQPFVPTAEFHVWPGRQERRSTFLDLRDDMGPVRRR